MQRSFSSPALVLRVRSSGESNREAVFLSAEEGIISATLFGGPKSRLRSHVSPFNTGLLWTYRDPAKDFRKISDFDVHSHRPGLRELYERSNTAFLVAAAILAGHGGGGAFGEAFKLANTVLDALDCADEACCERIRLYFFWNWAGILGNRGADANRCIYCACESSDDGVLWFIPGEGFLCKSCMIKEQVQNNNSWDQSEGKNRIALCSGARRWLITVQDKPPSELTRYTLDTKALGEIKTLINIIAS